MAKNTFVAEVTFKSLQKKKKRSFPLGISPGNVTKLVVSYRFVLIYWNP